MITQLKHTQQHIHDTVTAIKTDSDTVTTKIQTHCRAARAEIDRKEQEWLAAVSANKQSLLRDLSGRNESVGAAVASASSLARDLARLVSSSVPTFSLLQLSSVMHERGVTSTSVMISDDITRYIYQPITWKHSNNQHTNNITNGTVTSQRRQNNNNNNHNNNHNNVNGKNENDEGGIVGFLVLFIIILSAVFGKTGVPDE